MANRKIGYIFRGRTLLRLRFSSSGNYSNKAWMSNLRRIRIDIIFVLRLIRNHWRSFRYLMLWLRLLIRNLLNSRYRSRRSIYGWTRILWTRGALLLRVMLSFRLTWVRTKIRWRRSRLFRGKGLFRRLRRPRILRVRGLRSIWKRRTRRTRRKRGSTTTITMITTLATIATLTAFIIIWSSQVFIQTSCFNS